MLIQQPQIGYYNFKVISKRLTVLINSFFVALQTDSRLVSFYSETKIEHLSSGVIKAPPSKTLAFANTGGLPMCYIIFPALPLLR